MTQRLRLHRRAGDALEALYARNLEPHLAELAHHFFAAAAAGAEEKAIDYALRAGSRAASLLAYEEAVRLYETALTLIEDDEARCEVLLALGDAQARAGDTPAAYDPAGPMTASAHRRTRSAMRTASVWSSAVTSSEGPGYRVSTA